MNTLYRISLVLLTSFIYSCSTNVEKNKPNVILIMADDMGYECVGAYGSTSYQTPNIDKIANQGILFSNCVSQPLCTPSRVKIMTGKYNYRNYDFFGTPEPFGIYIWKFDAGCRLRHLHSWKVAIKRTSLSRYYCPIGMITHAPINSDLKNTAYGNSPKQEIKVRGMEIH